MDIPRNFKLMDELDNSSNFPGVSYGLQNPEDIDLDEEIILKRILSRSKTENRQDDKKEVIKTRISRYLSETKPLSDFYKSKKPSDYLVIDGNQEIEKITEDIVKKIKNDN